jgi:hypothetical protein
MLKEVGASGQISPVVSLPNGTQSHSAQEEASTYRVGDGWLTPERLASRKAAAERGPDETQRLARQWKSENQEVIDCMSQHYEAVGSMGLAHSRLAKELGRWS